MRARRAARTGARVLVLVTLLGSAASAARAQSTAEPVDGIVAIVGGHAPSPTTDVVLRSDVELRARLALATRTPDLPTGPLPPDLFAAVLEEIVNELLIAREARRLHAAEPGAGPIARQREEIARSVGGEERLRRICAALAVDLEEIDALATRRAYVNAFLRANLEGSTLISDAQVEQAHAAGNHPFAGAPLEEVREPLRAWLAQRALERDVARWVEVLRSRTPVRLIVRFAPGSSEAPGAPGPTASVEHGGS